jgi:hypothetical protein
MTEEETSECWVCHHPHHSSNANMLNRRHFLQTIGAGTLAAPFVNNIMAADAGSLPAKKKIAVVTTVWREFSHSWHMAERFLHGYPIQGEWDHPEIEIVSAYVDQVGDHDLSRDRANRYGFKIYSSIEEALRAGGKELAVDGVLVIGEHGDYPINEFGQKQYPRYRFFTEIEKVFRADGRAVPVFNDKHLSWNFDWANKMVSTSKELNFAFQAGSSLPVTWRMPDVDLPWGSELEEIMGIAFGSTDIYDFHTLEMMQCMAERRKGGETGVVAVRALSGDAVWNAMSQKSWSAGGWNPKLFEACLSRSQTLAQPETYSHRYPTPEQMREWVENPIAYRIEYRDGLKATMLLMNGLVNDFTFAAKLKNQDKPLSTLFYLPPVPNVVYSAALMAHAETMFTTGKAVYPVERTMLTSGMVQACLQSLSQDEQRKLTPQLSVSYQAAQESLYWKN